MVDANAVGRLAAAHAVARSTWSGRGRAPAGYVKGMAVMYAEMLERLAAGDKFALAMASGDLGPASKDALAHYADELEEAGLDASAGGPETLRALFVLMYGLGLRESSGRYCEGRDMSAKNTTAATAEAGLFQTSWDIHDGVPLVADLFALYQRAGSGVHAPDYLDVFKEGVTCKSTDFAVYGSGAGAEFQRMQKDSPAFAVEVAGVGLRQARGHWGPIVRKEAEISTGVDDMLKQVQRTGALAGAGDDEFAHTTTWLQWGLNKLGADPPLDVDGEWGPDTQAMVRMFQQENGLPATGEADQRTMDAVEAHLRAAFPTEYPAAPVPGPPVPPPPGPTPPYPPPQPPQPPPLPAGVVAEIRRHLAAIEALLAGQ